MSFEMVFNSMMSSYNCCLLEYWSPPVKAYSPLMWLWNKNKRLWMKILDLVRKYNLPLGRILTGVFYTYCLTINNHLIAYGFFCFFFPFYNKEHTPDPTSIFSEVRVFSAPFLYFSFGFSFLTLFVITTFFERFLCYSLNIF